MASSSDLPLSEHDFERLWVPCCDSEVRIQVPHEEAIHLNERNCKNCGRVWTFATAWKPLRQGNGWTTSVSIKLGRPTVPAVEEVLLNRDDDGWRDAHNRWEMQRLSDQLTTRAT